MTQHTAFNWDAYATHYDAINLLRPYQDLQRTLVRRLMEQNATHILDVSCGTGNLGTYISEVTEFSPRLTGVDISMEMLNYVRTKGNYVELHEANLDPGLPRFSRHFDAVVSCNTLYALENKQSFLNACYASLKPGGIFLLVDFLPENCNNLILKEHAGDTGDDAPWINADPIQLLEKVFADTRDVERVRDFARSNNAIDSSGFTFLPTATLTEMLQLAGFTHIANQPVYAKQANLFVCQY